MPESNPSTKRLKVRSDTLTGLAPQASIVTTPGTLDRMPRAQADTADTMPQARAFAPSPLDRGNAVVSSSSHLSWKALQEPDMPSGMMAGAGGGEIRQEMGQPKHMPGVVPKNKAPF
jgi:hypothetical protein